MAGRKRKILTLQERVKVVDRLEKVESLDEVCKLGCTAYNIQKLYVNALHISHTYTHMFSEHVMQC